MVKKFKMILRKFKIFKVILFILNISLLINTKVYANEYVFKKITDLKSPWGMSFINENELIISEQTGNLMIVNITDGKKSEIKHNLNFIKIGQGGLLDVIHKNNFIWIAYTEIREQWEINGFFGTVTSTSIAKGKFDKSKIN